MPPRTSAAPAKAAYPPAHVVQTILTDFYRHRGYVAAPRSLSGDPSTKFGADAPSIADRVVTEFAATEGYVRLDAERLEPRGARKWVVFFVLHGDRDYARNSPRLSNLLQLASETDPAARAGQLDELFVVAPDSFFEKTNLVEAFRGFQGRHRPPLDAPPGDPEGTSPVFTMCNYINFAVCVPEHVLSPPCRIMGEGEVEELLARERLRRGDLPHIHHVDPMVLWAGARADQVLEISRVSNTAGWAVYWRRVVNARSLPLPG